MIERSSRNLLKALGVGDFQATMVIPNLYQSPSVSDPKSAYASVIVSRMQDVMNQLGMNVGSSGVLDQPTANALQTMVGPGWDRMTWAENIAGVLSYAKAGPAPMLADQARAADQVFPSPSPAPAMSGIPTFGLSNTAAAAVYAVGGYVLYKLFFGKKSKTMTVRHSSTPARRSSVKVEVL